MLARPNQEPEALYPAARPTGVGVFGVSRDRHLIGLLGFRERSRKHGKRASQ